MIRFCTIGVADFGMFGILGCMIERHLRSLLILQPSKWRGIDHAGYLGFKTVQIVNFFEMVPTA